MSTKLKFGDLSSYYPRNLSAMSERELRREYQRLQSISRKRLERLEKAGLAETSLYGRYGHGFAKVSEFAKGNTRDLAKALYEVAWFATNERSTVSGERQSRADELEKLHRSGYDFVNAGNYDRFRKFMQTMREQGLVKAYGSDRVAEIFAQVEGSDPEEQILMVQEMFEEYF